jgi:cell wall-associated NlpC family hydrolase
MVGFRMDDGGVMAAIDGAPAAARVRRIAGGRFVALATVVLFSGVTIVGTTGSAWAAKKPIPTQAQVDQANANSKAKAEQIGETEAQLASANAQLDALNATAEARVEAYNEAQLKLAAAQQAFGVAQAALVTAKADRSKAQASMNQFAADSYRGASNVAQISALITSGSPEEFANKEAILAAIARHEQGIINLMQQAEAAQTAAQKAADKALSNQQHANADAENAKNAAIQAVNNQASQVSQIKSNESNLSAQLAVLKGKAKNLADARAQGLAEIAAEQAAARKAAAEAKARQLELAKEAAQQGGQGSGNAGSNGSNNPPLDAVDAGRGQSISTAAQRATAVAFAESKIGLWYRWAGTGEIGPTVTDQGTQNVPGYDCSGLTMRAYQAAGISIGHYTGLQWDSGMHVAKSDLVPGDLVFFATNINDPSTIHHVGIYIGDGQMVDAPQTGEQIGIHNAFRPDYIGAVRL